MIQTKRSSRAQRYRAEWYVLLATLFALGGYIGYSQYLEHIRIDSLERERLVGQALLIERNLAPQMHATRRAIDGILETLPSWHLERDSSRLANQHLQLITDTLAGIRSLLIINADGRVLSSNREEIVGMDLSQRDYFQNALKNANPRTLYVTPPFKTILNVFVMSFYRIIPGPSGEFAGIVIASVKPEYFGTLLDSVCYTPDTRAFLIHGDGKLFMVAPERPDLNGKNLAMPDSMFTRHRNSGQQVSMFAEIAYVTNEERMAAFRTIQPTDLYMDKPLVVAVSRDLQSIFAAWRRESLIQDAMFVAFALISILSLFFYQRRHRLFDQLEDNLEQVRKEGEKRFQSIFDASPDAQLISDEQGIITQANLQIEHLLGYSIDELIGQSIDSLMPERLRGEHPKLRAEFGASPVGRRMGQGRGVKARRKDGTECDVEISLSRIETKQGYLFISDLRDVTERKQAELAILKTNNKLQSLLDAVPDLLFEVGLDGRYYDYHSRRDDLLAAPADVLLGKTISEILPADAAEVCLSALQEAMEKGYSSGKEIFLPLPQGKHWFELSVASKHTGDDQDRRFIMLSRDVTARKLAEAELRIAAVAFESQEGMVITDADGVILRVNRAFTETTGYTAEEAIGQTPRLLKSGRHNEDFFHDMWETIGRTGGWQGEIWDRRKNGEVYPKWLTISTVKDDKGAVTHYIGAHFDITERKKAEERINELAFFDQLTGLPNRTLLLDRLRQTMTASSRIGCFGALLFIDLDHFKTLNDTLGHDMGDLLLKQVAQRLATCVRAGDTVARLGGDEFVVMLTSLSMNERDAATQAEAVGEKILAALNQTYQLNDVASRSTPSIGVTLFRGNRTEIDNLLKQADLAMYRSKEAGRNVLHFFDPDMETAVMKRAALEKDLREAVLEKQFLLHYQAQVAGASQLTGAEVLVRWQHPQRGMVSPAEFIPLAEETGLILPLGHWVLETACTQLVAWASRPELAHLTVAVNVSAHQFRQRDFVDQVLAVLNSTGANPQRLKLELTESLLVVNVEEVIEKMFALKGKGVGFSLDDFGTGYSSLSYLKRLPLDQLKIDQSFVRDILVDPNDASIAKTIIALAQSLGLGVIAEGVETKAQRDFLASAGCQAYQGYFFSRPLPIEGFEQFAQRL